MADGRMWARRIALASSGVTSVIGGKPSDAMVLEDGLRLRMERP